MQDVGTEGRTVLFVSHNMAAIKTLCSRGILLSKGGLIFNGNASEAIDLYQGSNHLERNEVVWADHDEAPGNELIRMKSIKISPLHGAILDIDSGVGITTVFYNAIADKNIDFTLYLYSLENICIFETGIIISNNNDAKVGYYITKGVIPAHLLNSGVYKITLVFGESQRYVLYKIEDVVSFEIEHTATGRGSNMSRSPGIIRPILNWAFDYDAKIK